MTLNLSDTGALSHIVWMPGLGFLLGRWLKQCIEQLPLDVLEAAAWPAPEHRVHALSVALSNMVLWSLCAWHWSHPMTALSWAVFSSFLLVLAWIDARTTLLPDAVTQPLLWCGLLASLQGYIQTPLTDAVLGAVVGYLFLRIIADVFERVTGKVGMGAGDFKLLAALGAWLGPWALLPVLLLASVVGACVGLVLQKRQALHEGGYLPFGPFLATAGGIVAWTAPQVLPWLFGQ